MAKNYSTTITFNNAPQGPAQSAFGSGNSNTLTTFGCGYEGDLNYSIPPNQLITITASSISATYGVIYAVLQKEFTLEASSDWEPFIPSTAGPVDQIAQAVLSTINGGTALSTVNPLSTRRMWKMTSPIRLTLDLYFLSIRNTQSEVIQPCMLLQQLALPTMGSLSVLGASIPLLSPPGPSPIFPDKGDQITISIGSLFTFKQVIVKTVKVTYDNRLDGDGLPISATASLEFETYEMLTKEKFSDAMNYGNSVVTPNIPGTGNATQQPTTLTQN